MTSHSILLLNEMNEHPMHTGDTWDAKESKNAKVKGWVLAETRLEGTENVFSGGEQGSKMNSTL